MKENLKIRLQIKICIKIRMNERLKTIPENIKEECSLEKNVYGYLREFEKEGVIEVERDNNKYIDIKLSEKGLQQLNDLMLTPYNNDIRSFVMRMDESSAPMVKVDDNLVNFVLSTKPELLSFIREVIVREYSTVIPNNFPDVFSPKLDEFFDNKFVNLNNISQK